MIPFFGSIGMIYMHWVPTGQTVNKEYNVEVLREFRKRFRRKRPALFKSDQWHKRFKEVRGSVRDDERCERSKEVNTTELIGQRVRVRVNMLRF